MSRVIGIDIGTTSTVGVLLDLATGRQRTASRSVTLYSPHPGWAEEDPEEWWRNLCAITNELLNADPSAAAKLGGIGVAGMVPAVILLDGARQLLRPSIQQSDARCGAEVSELAHEIDPTSFLSRTGNGLNQQIVAAKLRWLERHEPEVFSQIATVFGSYDWIGWQLTGELGTERNWALEAGFMDLATGAVANDLVALGHLGAKVVPPVRAADTVIGRVSPAASVKTGLPTGLPVIAGAADHIASAYAAGVIAPGDVLLKFGGAGDVLLATERATPDARVFVDYHVVPGLFMPNGCMASTGSLLNWLIRLIRVPQGEGSAHQRLDAVAAAVEAGSEGVTVLPYFLGEKSPIHDPDARGTISGLSLNHGPGHLWRAALEGTAYAFRHHVEVFSEIGYPVRRLLASDGGSASIVWMQIVADVLHRPVHLLTDHPGSALGAAWLAAIGTGLTGDWHGIAGLTGRGQMVEPNPARAPAYNAGFEQFRGLYSRLQPWFAAARH